MNKTDQHSLSDSDKELLRNFIDKAIFLNKKLLIHHKSFCDNDFGRVDEENKQEGNRKITAKILLLTSAQLSGQIIRALSSGSLLLASIGLRSLLEYLINTKYIFAHPKHIGDIKWMYKNCDDLFFRTKDPKAMKHQLGDVIPKNRAYDVGLSEIYNNTYADLCNYTHMMNHAMNVNDQRIFKKNTLLILQECLSYTHDIGEYICDCFRFRKNLTLEKEIVDYQDQCFKIADGIKV